MASPVLTSIVQSDTQKYSFCGSTDSDSVGPEYSVN